MKNILIKPVVTEKSELLSGMSKYTFIVNRSANKIEIKKEVERIYNVNVESVNTMVIPGKEKSRNTKSGVIKGMKPAYKKAVVSLVEGEELDFFGEL